MSKQTYERAANGGSTSRLSAADEARLDTCLPDIAAAHYGDAKRMGDG
jgi:hypothetical protein